MFRHAYGSAKPEHEIFGAAGACTGSVSVMSIACEGVPDNLLPKRAAALGQGFAEIFLVGRDFTLDESVQTLREVNSLSHYLPLYKLVPDASPPALQARLRITEDVVTDFGLDRVVPVVLLEELHTALEQRLRELLPDFPKSPRWPTPVQEAEKAGFVSSKRGPLDTDDWPGHEHTDPQLILEEGINPTGTLRNTAKQAPTTPGSPSTGSVSHCYWNIWCESFQGDSAGRSAPRRRLHTGHDLAYGVFTVARRSLCPE
jgi:hypothetical protein